ncbi:MAG: hypothetical protein JNJ51_08440 [Methylobacillus glycogenes]|nr:hypothetical protein [Methylobacillus glycogenes]
METTSTTTSLTSNKWVAIGIGLGIAYAVYKFGPNQAVKAAAMGVIGTIVARQVPFVQTALVA